ncbi:hypothetical protein HDV03_004656 [Kappamyces sp. JEL0829]|nr:hypothetical protein HDV03_004656 [Kappamyces sp. JEL0829]
MNVSQPNTTHDAPFLLQLCDFNLYYLGCDKKALVVYSTIDQVLATMTLAVAVLMMLHIGRKILKRSPFRRVEMASFPILLLLLAKVTYFYHASRIQFLPADLSTVDYSVLRLYFQTNIFLELLTHLCGGVVFQIMVASIESIARAGRLYHPIKILHRTIPTEKILLWNRILVVSSIVPCTVLMALTDDFRTFLIYRTYIYGITVFQGYFFLPACLLFFGNRLIATLGEKILIDRREVEQKDCAAVSKSQLSINSMEGTIQKSSLVDRIPAWEPGNKFAAKKTNPIPFSGIALGPKSVPSTQPTTDAPWFRIDTLFMVRFGVYGTSWCFFNSATFHLFLIILFFYPSPWARLGCHALYFLFYPYALAYLVMTVNVLEQ